MFIHSADALELGARVGAEKLLAELRRRNMLRAAAFYAATAWLLVQIATQVLPFFELPRWMVRWIIVAALVGFPFWMAFAWFHEITPTGFRRDTGVSANESVRRATSRRLDLWIIGILAGAVILLLTDRFVTREPVAEAAEASVAVLPLANASGDEDQVYFSDGLSEDLINALSKFEGLKVISRNSSFQFRDSKDDARTIGDKLGVDHLLEGSVRRAGNTVRITAQLVNADDGSTLWSEQYDRPYRDLFALQDEITRAVADALKAHLLPDAVSVAQNDRPPSGNLEAYSAFLRGQFHLARLTEVDYRKAIDAFTEATRLDPRYAAAWAKLAYTRSWFAGGFLAGESARRENARARTAADKALELAPNLSVVHVSRCFLFQLADLDWIAAEAECRRAVQLAPNDVVARFALGNLLATLGQTADAIELAWPRLAADPLNAGQRAPISMYLMQLGRLDEASRMIDEAIKLQPGGLGFYMNKAIIEILRGNPGAALAAARQEPAEGPWRLPALALALQVGTDEHAADAALQELIDMQSADFAYQIAEVYALRKDPDNMFEWLDRAWDNRDAGIGVLLYDPLILHYRDDPRFAAYCAKVGLPDPAAIMARATPVPVRGPRG